VRIPLALNTSNIFQRGTPDERGNVGRLSNPRWDEKLTSINADMTVRGSAAWLTSLITEQQLNGES